MHCSVGTPSPPAPSSPHKTNGGERQKQLLTAWPEPWSITVVPGCTPFSSELREATDMRVRVPTHTVLMSRQTGPVQSSLRTWGLRTQRPSCLLLDEDGKGEHGGPCLSPWSRWMVLCFWEACGCGNRPVTHACVQKRRREC